MFKQQFDNQQTIYSTVFVSFLYDTKNFPYKMMFEEGCALKKKSVLFQTTEAASKIQRHERHKHSSKLWTTPTSSGRKT